MVANHISSLFLFLFLFLFCYASPSVSDSSSFPLSGILSSPQFFHSNHARMLSSFKIFIYPLSTAPQEAPHFKLPWLLQSQDTSVLFFYLLSQSSFVTHDPEAAGLYFIPPFYSSSLSSSSSSSLPEMVPLNRKKSARDLVQKLREEFPFWQRTLGGDHFFGVCHRFPGDGSRNVLELQKNAISMACSELFCNNDDGSTNITQEEGMDPQFFPHKDIVLPPFQNDSLHNKKEAIAEEYLLSRPRAYLVYAMDSMNTVARKLWLHDSEFLFHSDQDLSETSQNWAETGQGTSQTDQNESGSSQDIPQTIASSKFCLTFATQGLIKIRKKKSISIVDAMVAGCVPVIISHGYLHSLPFQDILDWTKFSVIVSSSEDMGKLKAYLKAMPEAKYRELQRNAISASTHFQWNVPPTPYDAFYMIMHQLWLRQHSVRYARRNMGIQS